MRRLRTPSTHSLVSNWTVLPTSGALAPGAPIVPGRSRPRRPRAPQSLGSAPDRRPAPEPSARRRRGTIPTRDPFSDMMFSLSHLQPHLHRPWPTGPSAISPLSRNSLRADGGSCLSVQPGISCRPFLPLHKELGAAKEHVRPAVVLQATEQITGGEARRTSSGMCLTPCRRGRL